MRRSLYRTTLVAALTVFAAGCDNVDESVPTTPTTPPTVTTTLSGSININGAETKPFAVSAAGLVTATLKTVAPDATIAVGLGLGTWNGVNCAVALSNESALQGINVIGNVSARGDLCVRIFDVGKLTGPIEYTVEVTHF